MAEADRERILSEPLPSPTSKSLTNINTLRKRITEVQKAGIAIGDGDAIDYVIAIGAPIFGRDGVLLGAISVGSIKRRYPPQRIREVSAIVREAAARIGALLGGSPLPDTESTRRNH